MSVTVLYITRNGMLEPLGQSQVLAYLRGLSRDFEITLISFEKPEDMADSAAMQRVREDCEGQGIRWLPQRFHYRPKLVAPGWSMFVFLWLCLREVRGGNADLIHARSYLPAFVALLVGRLSGTPFIFDMRALWPEELITAGRLKRGSLLHRSLMRGERSCLHRAAAVVSLTDAAITHLKNAYPNELAGQKTVVIPTCADLDRFSPLPQLQKGNQGPRVYGCIGTVLSGWFRLDWLAAFYRTVADREPDASFEIVTRDDEETIRRAIGGSSSLQQRLKIYAKAPQDVHEAIQRQSVSAMFFTQGLSKLGSSPTRMGEILGCGIPVVANRGVGDVARIVTEYAVGVLVEDGSDRAMQKALKMLKHLQADAELPVRCRRAAEEVFSLRIGTANYRALYEGIVSQEGGDSGCMT